MAYDHRPLAKKYAQWLPPGCPYDWEDIYQEMMAAEAEQHGSMKSLHWAAKHMIAKERVRAKPFRAHLPTPRNVQLDAICDAYNLIGRWPWLIGLLLAEGNVREMARNASLDHTSILKRLKKIREELHKDENNYRLARATHCPARMGI